MTLGCNDIEIRKLEFVEKKSITLLSYLSGKSKLDKLSCCTAASSCKDIGIWQFECAAKNQLLSCKISIINPLFEELLRGTKIHFSNMWLLFSYLYVKSKLVEQRGLKVVPVMWLKFTILPLSLVYSGSVRGMLI